MKPVVFLLALAPGLWLLFRTLTDRLSANPIEDLTLVTGIWALRFLLLSLAITPIRRLTGWNGAIQYRRMIGLFAFAYATVRLVEAYGLWRLRPWAEWLALVSGGLYLPVEAYELWRRATVTRAALLAANVLVVALLVYVRFRRPGEPHRPHP